MEQSEMRAGDSVTLRSPSEILATLDENGTTDGMPFMPEMVDFFGKSFRIEGRVERACDTLKWGVRRVPDTVFLDDLRCSGSAHGGCQAACRLYWKESWLRRASEATPVPPAESDDAYARLVALASANVEAPTSTTEEPIFRCQGTDWFKASEPIGWWNVPSLVREWTCGNVGLWRLTTSMVRIVFGEIGRKLRLIPERGFMHYDPSVERVTPPPCGLQAGTLVQVRSRKEIELTLDEGGNNRGLWFDREMLPFCGKTFPVKSRVERFVDERSGKMIRLKSDCYILDGATCSGDLSAGKWFCRRAIYTWWREAWLKPADEEGPGTTTNSR
jgi:hypothetical protein